MPDTTPYADPPGRHRHRCPACAAVWEHENGADLYGTGSHDCPACGEGQCEIHRGPEAPTHADRLAPAVKIAE